MKPWHHTLFGFLAGVLLLATILLTAIPPRGTQVMLLPAPTAAPLAIHVTGAVSEPGVYHLPPGSRVEDALRAAGGLAPDADDALLNLAARLSDGSQVRVLRQGEKDTQAFKPSDEATSGSLDAGQHLVNINTATLEELQTLPGIGQVRAEQIIVYREAHGGFKSCEELQEVPGIGPATYQRLAPLVSIDDQPTPLPDS